MPCDILINNAIPLFKYLTSLFITIQVNMMNSSMIAFPAKPSLHKKIQELNLAHNCGVLMYSRDKVCINLAKKIRPEFSKFYLSSEVKDCIRMIEKFNKSVDNIGIDIVS